MKIAISAMEKDPNAQIDPRFGRAPYFVMVDTETMDLQMFDNENCNHPSGAGIQTASFIAAQGVGAVLTGNCGPKAMQALTEADIRVFTGHSGTVQEAVDQYKNDRLTATETATVAEKSGAVPPGTDGKRQPRLDNGMANGGGRGMGGCGGGGMGGGGGCGKGGGGGGGRGKGGGGGRGMAGGGGMGARRQ
ncbi:MAG: NifB/NifX family molybdenum-iron cluster-binding protein [Desulfobacterium sp.]|nr:NifB/NifX family molybdenum-iron cluster-binding protein [Desulfobacterium sp.]